MKKESISRALGEIDAKYLTETPVRRTTLWRVGAAAAACLLLVAAVPFFFRQPQSPAPISHERTYAMPAFETSRSLTEALTANTVAGKAADQTFAEAQTSFALDLFKRQLKAGENTLLSPTSVMYALTMTANGAAGQTKDEMERVLGQGLTLDELNEYLSADLKRRGEDDPFALADAIWYRDGVSVKETFAQKNTDYFHAALYQAPFDATTVGEINGWVKAKTHGMIDKLLDEIKENEMFHIVNAVAFEGAWQNEPTKVKNGTFTAADKKKQKATMMTFSENFYLYDDHATGFVKYYKGSKYAFAALLPSEGMNAEDYVSSLTAPKLLSLLAEAWDMEVTVTMPRFSVDFSCELSEVLKEMGMKQAFEAAADFSAMSDVDLFIETIDHKTHIEVDETGTRAAAVTDVRIYGNGMPQNPEKPKTVVLDRPFVYMILDTEANIPLFLGTLNTLN